MAVPLLEAMWNPLNSNVWSLPNADECRNGVPGIPNLGDVA